MTGLLTHTTYGTLLLYAGFTLLCAENIQVPDAGWCLVNPSTGSSISSQLPSPQKTPRHPNAIYALIQLKRTNRIMQDVGQEHSLCRRWVILQLKVTLT